MRAVKTILLSCRSCSRLRSFSARFRCFSSCIGDALAEVLVSADATDPLQGTRKARERRRKERDGGGKRGTKEIRDPKLVATRAGACVKASVLRSVERGSTTLGGAYAKEFLASGEAASDLASGEPATGEPETEPETDPRPPRAGARTARSGDLSREVMASGSTHEYMKVLWTRAFFLNAWCESSGCCTAKDARISNSDISAGYPAICGGEVVRTMVRNLCARFHFRHASHAEQRVAYVDWHVVFVCLRRFLPGITVLCSKKDQSQAVWLIQRLHRVSQGRAKAVGLRRGFGCSSKVAKMQLNGSVEHDLLCTSSSASRNRCVSASEI